MHAAAVEALRIPDEDRTQMLTEHPAEAFEIPPGKGERFTLVEVTMFAGRSLDAKRRPTERDAGMPHRLHPPAALAWSTWLEGGPMAARLRPARLVERVTGIEPASRAWKARPGSPLSRHASRMPQFSAPLNRPLLSVGNRQGPMLRAQGGHGRWVRPRAKHGAAVTSSTGKGGT